MSQTPAPAEVDKVETDVVVVELDVDDEPPVLLSELLAVLLVELEPLELVLAEPGAF
jgi:hypothetical protein